MRIIITAPSLDTAKNVSGVSSVVRFIIENNLVGQYIHFELGKQDNEKRGLHRLASLAKAWVQWRRMMKEDRKDIVHYSFPLSAPSIIRDPLFMWMAKHMGHKMVVHIHGGLFLTAPKTPWLLKKIMKWVFSWDVPFIVLSDKERDILMDRYSARNVIVLPNSVNIPEKDNYAYKNSSEEGAGESRKTIILGYLGRIEENKGMRELLSACIKLKEDGIDFKLRFAGKEQKENEFIPEYKRMLGEKFEYVGLVSGRKKDDFIRSLDIFIMPTYFEGLPMSLLECMSYGVMPIVTPVGSIPTTVHGKSSTKTIITEEKRYEEYDSVNDANGIFIKPKDVESIVEAVKIIEKNTNLLEQLGKNARKTVIQNFSPKKYVEQLNKIYNSLTEV